MVRLFRDEARPAEGALAWYIERRERCRNLLWDLARDVVSCGTEVYLELGLLQSREREAYYVRARADGFRFIVHVLDAERSIRRERVAARNLSPGLYTQIVPPEFFELASDAWEPPCEAERLAWGLIDE